MDLSCSVSEINGGFGRNSQFFPSSRAFTIHVEEVPLEFCNGGAKLPMMPQQDGSKRFIHLDTIPQRGQRTKGHREMVNQYRSLHTNAR